MGRVLDLINAQNNIKTSDFNDRPLEIIRAKRKLRGKIMPKDFYPYLNKYLNKNPKSMAIKISSLNEMYLFEKTAWKEMIDQILKDALGAEHSKIMGKVRKGWENVESFIKKDPGLNNIYKEIKGHSFFKNPTISNGINMVGKLRKITTKNPLTTTGKLIYKNPILKKSLIGGLGLGGAYMGYNALKDLNANAPRAARMGYRDLF